MKSTARFTGLKLTAADRRELKRLQGAGQQTTARIWRRIQTLLALDRGLSLSAAARALGTYPREVSRVARRYIDKGLQHALSEEPREGSKPMLDSTQEAALVALVCGPPPQGRARWTVRLLAEQAVHRRIVDRIGRETVRVVLAEHKLKPWREKNVVRSGAHGGIRRADGGRAGAVRTTVQGKRAGRRAG